MGKLIADVGTAGRPKHARRDAHRQLGGRLAELDAAVPRGVPAAARLRSAPVSAGDDRPRRGQPGGLRAVSSGTCGRRSPTCWWRTTPGTSATLAHRHGLRLSIEAYDGAPCDDLTYAGRADEPMAEFWSWRFQRRPTVAPEMASAAHVYGKPILGAEAFTATDAEKWQGHPATIKALGDWAFCEGINRFVFHRYALQPWTDSPARHDDGAVGPALRAHADLVGAVRAPGTSTSPAASSCCSKGCSWPTSASWRRKARRSGSTARRLCRRPYPGPARLQLRRLPARGRAHAHVGQGRPARAARRHELPDAGPAAASRR